MRAGQAAVLTRTRRQRPTVPRIKAARGDFEQSAHHPHRVAGLVRLHESEQRFGVAVLSFAIPKPRLLTKSPARSRAVGSHVADVSAPPLCRRQAAIATTSVPVGLLDPLADRLGRAAERSRQLMEATTLTHQLDHLTPQSQHLTVN